MQAIESALLDIRSLSNHQLQDIFSLATELKKRKRPAQYVGKSLALLFFEPSTRTRMSFEAAAHKLGLGTLSLSGDKGTSLEKGETIEDSILNIAAMKPELMVIRCGDKVNLAEISKKISCPMINAGWGVQGHPTQALLDAFTLQELFQSQLDKKKILILGDIKHSRVATSHFELAEKLGYEVAVCGPKEFLPDSSHRKFDKLSDALSWCDVVMALRVQFERHEQEPGIAKELYREIYGLNKNSLKNLKSGGFILHPGPINHGIEIETEILQDPRCQVLNQVTHGVILREALLRWMLGESK